MISYAKDAVGGQRVASISRHVQSYSTMPNHNQGEIFPSEKEDGIIGQNFLTRHAVRVSN